MYSTSRQTDAACAFLIHSSERRSTAEWCCPCARFCIDELPNGSKRSHGRNRTTSRITMLGLMILALSIGSSEPVGRARLQHAPQAAIEMLSGAESLAQRHNLELPLAARRERALAFDTIGNFDAARTDLEAVLQFAGSRGDWQAEWQALVDLGQLLVVARLCENRRSVSASARDSSCRGRRLRHRILVESHWKLAPQRGTSRGCVPASPGGSVAL